MDSMRHAHMLLVCILLSKLLFFFYEKHMTDISFFLKFYHVIVLINW